MVKLIKKERLLTFWNTLEFNRYGISPVLLLLQSCLGSIAVCYVLALPYDKQLLPLILISVSTMLANAGIISLMPMKWNLRLFALSMSISCLSLIYALL